jgi:hypothetical protein
MGPMCPSALWQFGRFPSMDVSIFQTMYWSDSFTIFMDSGCQRRPRSRRTPGSAHHLGNAGYAILTQLPPLSTDYNRISGRRVIRGGGCLDQYSRYAACVRYLRDDDE